MVRYVIDLPVSAAVADVAGAPASVIERIVRTIGRPDYPEIPDGWVLVPRKITEAMKDRVRDHGGVQAVAYALAAWPDLLAAAPLPPGKGGPAAWLLNHPVHGETCLRRR